MSPRIRALQKRILNAQVNDQLFTAVVTLDGFPLPAQKVQGSDLAQYWGFSHGINSTFQFEVPRERPPRRMIETPIDHEIGEGNGEGVDVFTVHGIKKQQLMLTLYPRLTAAPYYMRYTDRNLPIPRYNDGLFGVMRTTLVSPLGGEPEVVMEWHFFQVNRFALNGDTNRLVHAGGSQIEVSFEPDDPIE